MVNKNYNDNKVPALGYIYILISVLDFQEFDSSNEKLLWCQHDICLFWDSEDNRGFSLKSIKDLKKRDIAQSTTLNTSIYYTNIEPSTSPFSPAGGSAMYSPFGRAPQKNSGLRMNRYTQN